ncbi:MAG TPA: CHAT domain-containing tetratricopeptide repeat protein [Pyrinomonadaceae bacterium]|nr:CHAT domain-containing tetratricopeptide repeat protein [Pyrinomonadaceae bacterium]
MRGLRLLLFGLTVTFGSAFVASAQNDDDAPIIEADYAVTTAAAQRQAVTDLRLQADELRKAGDVVQAARTLNRVGRFQIRMSAPREAVLTFKESLQLLEQHPDLKARVDNLNGLASAYENWSKCDQAEPLLEQAIKDSQQDNYVAGRAEALWIRSDCEDPKDHRKALETVHESLELWRSLNRKRGMAQAYMTIGKFQMAQSDLTESRLNLDTALSLYRELNSVERQIVILIYFGFIEHRKGAWQHALDHYAQARALVDEKSEPYKMGQIATGVGEAFLEAGLPEIALGKFQEALEHYISSQNERAQTVAKWYIGRTHYLAGEYTAARENLLTARSEASSRGDVTLVAHCDDYLGRTYAALRDPEALGYFQSALNGFTLAKNPLETARTRVLMGGLYQRQGKIDLARQYYQTSLESFRALSDRVNESATLYALGDLELRQNNLEKAEAYLNESITATEKMRRVSTTRDLTAAISATVQNRYDRYVECLMRMHRAYPDRALDVRAFETVELARARSLAELLRATSADPIAGLDPELALEELMLRQSLRVKEDAQVALLATAYKKEDLEKLKQELVQLDVAYGKLWTKIRQRYPAFASITHPISLKLPQIRQQLLASGENVLLEYSLGQEQSYLWVVTDSEFLAYELPARSEIEPVARQFYDALTARQPKRGVSLEERLERVKQADAGLPAVTTNLSRILLGPIADRLFKKRLLIVADGALQYVPFQFLTRSLATPGAKYDDARPLILDHEIVNQPSASILTFLKKPVTAVPGSVAILADPVFEYADSRVTSPESKRESPTTLRAQQLSAVYRDVGQLDGEALPRLLGSRNEAKAIMNIVPWNTGFQATDFDASRATLTGARLDQFGIVHFATHAYVDDKYPERSGIVLSLFDQKGLPQEGYLSMDAIYGLRLPVQLVVLSGCKTGLGKEVQGEGLIGLTRAFMYAGASGVAASLWKVDDDATAELMKRFYEGMFQQGLTPAAALRQAQIGMWNEGNWRHPYYWAGFIIQGQYDQKVSFASSSLSSSDWSVTMAGLLSALFLACCVALKWRRKTLL